MVSAMQTLFDLQAVIRSQHHLRAHPPGQREIHAAQSQGLLLLFCSFKSGKGESR